MMADDDAIESLAVRRRRECRREEWLMQTEFAGLLDKHRDPSCTWWTSLENKPLSMLSGLFQKRRGVRSGLPDVMVLFRHDTGTMVIFIELKSCRGRVSPDQKQVREEMLRTGARWFMARSARSAMAALVREGVPLRKAWTPPLLQEWEGPFSDLSRLPAHPIVRAERREEKRRYRLRREIRAREAAEPDQERCIA